jgi:uncharacterized small protein (DUF1192 family)
MNELNFARFDAKLDQRIAELRSDTAKLDASLRADMAKLEASLRADIATLEARLDAKIDAKIDRTASQLREELDSALQKQYRFFFLAWAALLVAIVAPRFH